MLLRNMVSNPLLLRYVVLSDHMDMEFLDFFLCLAVFSLITSLCPRQLFIYIPFRFL